jgi:hypothetical protein
MQAAAAFRANVPEGMRFVVSGGIGSAAFWALNEVLVAHSPIDWQRITVAWFVSYLLSIWLQHFLHSTLVYGWTTSYFKGLAATYAGYSAALVAGVPINFCLVHYALLSSSQAWLGTLLITGCANYFILSAALGSSKKAAGTPATTPAKKAHGAHF